MKVVLVTGGREYSDAEKVRSTLNMVYTERFPIDYLMEGGARGADYLAHLWAVENGIQPVTMYANWDFYGKAAGSKRNGNMLSLVKIDLVVAFPGGNGTADMVRKARAVGIEVLEIK
jgi:hypothetical protein